MKLFLTFLTVMLFSTSVFSQNERAFIIYNSKGKKVSYKKLEKAAVQQDFVFFGEYHDNPISHWLQYELTEAMFAKHGDNLQLGFEMFERDQQMLLREYLDNLVTDEVFEDSCRLWPNYATDYKPIIMFAKQNKIFCNADNIPRRYASLLFKRGRQALDSLSQDDKAYIAPLNFVVDSTLSQYSALQEMEQHMGGSHMMEAQAIKDATMAHFILLHKKENNVVLHFNGAYHSDYYQGIVWYIRQAKPEAKVSTISTVTQMNISKLDAEHKGKADFIICVPESMTRTH
jgi:uncharacterized iron-regulated protein